MIVALGELADNKIVEFVIPPLRKHVVSKVYKCVFYDPICITNSMERQYVLSENDQMKITYFINNSAKSEPNLLKYSECVALMLERCIFNTKFTLVDFHPLFDAALKVKGVKPSDKTEVQG